MESFMWKLKDNYAHMFSQINVVLFDFIVRDLRYYQNGIEFCYQNLTFVITNLKKNSIDFFVVENKTPYLMVANFAVSNEVSNEEFQKVIQTFLSSIEEIEQKIANFKNLKKEEKEKKDQIISYGFERLINPADYLQFWLSYKNMEKEDLNILLNLVKKYHK